VGDAGRGLVPRTGLYDERDRARAGALVVAGDLDAVGVDGREGGGGRSRVRPRARGGDGGADGLSAESSSAESRHAQLLRCRE
jgi:hypothetical protein